ncbi:hypothetical protein [Streptomyces tritici]|uniref:hypothetical protein n=1 Tax=Streptomyces tritici TaxID=2054410 RepID=UPI003AF1D1D5
MFSPPTSAPPDRRPAAHGDEAADAAAAAARIRRTFLAANTVLALITLVMSCTPALAGVTVYGRLTLGLVWGLIHIAGFLAGVWWYEHRSARPDDRAGHRRRRSPSPGAETSHGTGW